MCGARLSLLALTVWCVRPRGHVSRHLAGALERPWWLRALPLLPLVLVALLALVAWVLGL